MSAKGEVLVNIPMSLKFSPQLSNWTKTLEHGGNITKHHIEIHSDSDEDVSSVVIVSVGLIMMILMLIAHKCSKEERSRYGNEG